MSLGSLYINLSKYSPFLETCLRKLYWANVERLSKFSTNKDERKHRTEFVDFEEIIEYIKSCGIGEGSLVIMHSSYGTLKPTSLDHVGIIDRLIKLIGPEGTLAAPVIRSYSEEERISILDSFNGKCADITCIYDLKNTPIWSGLLSKTVMNHEESVTSMHPLNPMTAVGKCAKAMMEHNIDGELPSAHGPNSSWKFCADHDAYILYLGVDFGHHITMQQVVTESFLEHQPKDFFYKRKFIIKNGDFERELWVNERKRNMTVNLPELCVREDVVKSGIMKMTDIKGIPVCVCKAKDLIDFFTSQRKYYPYFFPFHNR